MNEWIKPRYKLETTTRTEVIAHIKTACVRVTGLLTEKSLAPESSKKQRKKRNILVKNRTHASSWKISWQKEENWNVMIIYRYNVMRVREKRNRKNKEEWKWRTERKNCSQAEKLKQTDVFRVREETAWLHGSRNGTWKRSEVEVLSNETKSFSPTTREKNI